MIKLTDARATIGYMHLPSERDRCPRLLYASGPSRSRKCAALMECIPAEQALIWRCPACGYEATETNAGMRAAFLELRRMK